MSYGRIYTWEVDKDTFVELKHKKEIQLKRNLSEVEFFHMILEVYERDQAQKENVKELNANISDGVTG